MRRIVFSLLFLLMPLFSFAQKDVFEQSIEEINKVNDILIDCMASFMEFPETHSNTINIYDRVVTIKKLCKDQQSSKYQMSTSILSNPKVQQYYRMIDQIQIYADIFEELLRSFKGYNSAGLSQDQMGILDPMFRKFGWKINLLDINCKDAYFYEYQLKGCKMMFIKNTLPPNDYRNYIYHNIEVDFTYDYYGTGGKYYVGGGLYRIIQFKDDENVKYHKVIKASSERK